MNPALVVCRLLTPPLAPRSQVIPCLGQPRRVSCELAAIIKQQNNFNNNFTVNSNDLYQRVDGLDDVYMPSKSFLDTENSLEATPKFSRLSNGSSEQGRFTTDFLESKIAHNIRLDTQAPKTRSRSSKLKFLPT